MWSNLRFACRLIFAWYMAIPHETGHFLVAWVAFRHPQKPKFQIEGTNKNGGIGLVQFHGSVPVRSRSKPELTLYHFVLELFLLLAGSLANLLAAIFIVVITFTFVENSLAKIPLLLLAIVQLRGGRAGLNTKYTAGDGTKILAYLRLVFQSQRTFAWVFCIAKQSGLVDQKPYWRNIISGKKGGKVIGSVLPFRGYLFLQTFNVVFIFTMISLSLGSWFILLVYLKSIFF